MNLYQLRYFVTLAKEEHYTKATAKSHITTEFDSCNSSNGR